MVSWSSNSEESEKNLFRLINPEKLQDTKVPRYVYRYALKINEEERTLRTFRLKLHQNK